MAHWSPSFETPGPRRRPHSWSRWSSLLRLALWGGDAECGQCGSRRVRRVWADWTHALGLDACRCDACGATFHVPRRAATAGLEEPGEASPMLTLPPPPEVDLAALDRAMAARLPRRRRSK